MDFEGLINCQYFSVPHFLGQKILIAPIFFKWVFSSKEEYFSLSNYAQ